MSNELVSILVGLPTVGVALIAVILTSNHGLGQDVIQMGNRLREDVVKGRHA